MILKIFKGVWFLSMIATLANLLYVYAGLPENVVLYEEGIKTMTIGREPLFYAAMTVIALMNVLGYLFNRSIAPDEIFRTWLHGLMITLNIFFVIGWSFISLFNSTEKFEYARIGIIIYSSIALIIIWTLSWPVILLGRKLFPKQSI